MTWPDLPYDTWAETATTLQLWMQIVGKIRLVQTPWINHAWHVPLYLNGRGLTTSLISHGADFLEISFDFIDQQLVIESSRNNHRCQVPLRPCSVAAFYADVDAGLRSLGDPIAINTVPCEMSEATPFEQDSRQRDYDGEAATRFWRTLLQVQRVFQEFRARFIGKCSPIHFFWGSFDLAVTRFSGRVAPEHPGGCLLYTSPSPRDQRGSRMPSSA